MANPAQDFKKEIKGGVRDANQALETISHDVGARTGELVSKVSGSMTDYYATSRDFVKSNPVKGVAVAAAAGIVVGSILTLAMRSK